MSWRGAPIITYADVQADAPNGFSFAKMRQARSNRMRFFCSTPQFRARVRFELYKASAHNAMMTMVYHTTPAVIYRTPQWRNAVIGKPGRSISTCTYPTPSGWCHVVEERDDQGNIVSRTEERRP